MCIYGSNVCEQVDGKSVMISCHMFCAKVDLAWSRLIQEGGGALLAQTNLSLFFLQLAFQIVFRLLKDLTSARKFNLSVNSSEKSSHCDPSQTRGLSCTGLESNAD